MLDEVSRPKFYSRLPLTRDVGPGYHRGEARIEEVPAGTSTRYGHGGSMRGAHRPLPTEEGGWPFICGGERPLLVTEGRGRAEALIEVGCGLGIGGGSLTLARP